MSDTSVRQDWCPIHGHVKVQRFSPRAKFSWWECLQCGLASKPAPVGTQCDGSAAPRREDAAGERESDPSDDYVAVLTGPDSPTKAHYLAELIKYGEPQDMRISTASVVRRLLAALSTAEREREDAERWRALMTCGRLRVMGGAAWGTPSQHIGVEIWETYPGATPSQSENSRAELTRFVDGCRARVPSGGET